MPHLVTTATLDTGAILAVAVQADGELAVVEPDSPDAIAFQLTRPVCVQAHMTWRNGPQGRRRRNVDAYRCHGMVSGRKAALTIALSTTTVPTVESLLDWPASALIGVHR